MGKNLEKLAYDLITRHPFLIARAKKWGPNEVPTLNADDLLEIAEMSRRRETLPLEINKPVVVECIGEPRTIDTNEGGWEVVDVSLPDGSEHLLSLGRTVLRKKIAEQIPTTGKRLVVMNLGQPTGKRYFNYVVMTLEAWKVAQKAKATKKKGK